jgi:hypothetical protein
MSYGHEIFQKVTHEVHESLLPACQHNYSKDIKTAKEMQETGKGNCFTYAEAASLQLIGRAAIKTVGLYVTLAPRRTNYHTGCIAFGDNDHVALLDLIKENVVYPRMNRLYHAAHDALAIDEGWLYAYTAGNGDEPDQYIQLKKETVFAWPEDSRLQTVYMPLGVGISALHAIAERGGMRHTDLLQDDTSCPIPALPAK